MLNLPWWKAESDERMLYARQERAGTCTIMSIYERRTRHMTLLSFRNTHTFLLAIMTPALKPGQSVSYDVDADDDFLDVYDVFCCDFFFLFAARRRKKACASDIRRSTKAGVFVCL